ncbi:hypothetical protein MKQ70_25060 [Chitinophaga sedimenti]|uniref:hypothetical protein n=1 Tax=Chitinophaga sedimenti TaxID=2033606 RepID=UPI002004E8EA|nr:hypothetical protein [Chitinophaga sedimenti]MCK7558097.1 hypothetical protein [Chitinophaga sedimenti]
MRSGARQIMGWYNPREVNISAYIIQRRQPGSQAWTELSTIAATGSNSSYSFTDTTYIPGLAEYRLLVRDAFNVHSVSNRVILNPETGNAAAYESYQLFRTGTTLAWNAYMEINVAQHQLQRKVGAENWSTIKTIAVAQESTGASTAYSFNDSTFEPREKSYRVLTTDNFGGEYISNIVEVPMDSSVSVADYKIIASNLIRSFDRQYLSWVTDGERNLVNMRVERFRDYGWEPVRTISPKGRGVYEVMDSLYYAGHISYRLLIDDRFGVTDTAFVLELGNDTSLNGYMEMGPLNVERQGKVQQLTWTSTKEFKIDCYEIRRIVNTGWEVVDTVTAVGSGNNYIYVDTIFRPDTVRYQVLAYDHTGSGYYSTPVLLEADTIYNSAFTTATPQVERQYDIQRLRITTWKERGLKNIIAEVRDDSAWKRLAIWPAAGSGQTYTFSDSVYRRPQTSYRWMAEDLDGKLLEGPQYVLAADTVKVERAEFTGGLVARKEHKQVITWTMGRSVMMANYSLQYSADSINWSTVPVAAISDEGSDKMYSITDSSYHPYTTYYRIKGLSQWSNIFIFHCRNSRQTLDEHLHTILPVLPCNAPILRNEWCGIAHRRQTSCDTY